MPKPLFYLGVIFSALTGVLAVSIAPDLLAPAAPQMLAALSPLRPLAILFLAIPVAALFLRMASLVAARNLFAAQFAIFAVACTTIAVGLLSTVQFRLLLMMRRVGQSVSDPSFLAVTELQLIALYAVGFFLSLTLLSMRPYFRLRGRILAAMVLVPVPLYLGMLIEQYLSAPAVESGLGVSSSLTFLYLVLIAALFIAVSIHCVRRRHLFVEVTNLRELLDTRRLEQAPVRRRNGFRFDNDAILEG